MQSSGTVEVIKKSISNSVYLWVLNHNLSMAFPADLNVFSLLKLVY